MYSAVNVPEGKEVSPLPAVFVEMFLSTVLRVQLTNSMICFFGTNISRLVLEKGTAHNQSQQASRDNGRREQEPSKKRPSSSGSKHN